MEKTRFMLGVNGHPLTSIPYNSLSSSVPGITAQQQVDIMVELGIGWYRIDVNTDNDGRALADSAFRSVINRCNNAGIQVLPMFYDNSEAFQTTGDTEGAYNNAYKKMAGVAAEYGGLFTHCELGNRWELSRNLLNRPGLGTEAAHYNLDRLEVCLAYLKGMEDGLKSTRPEIKTILNTSGYYPLHWARQAFATVSSIDICGWHWYADMAAVVKSTLGWEDVLPELYKEFGRPIWITSSNSKWDPNKTEEENDQEQVYWFNKFSMDCREFPYCEAYFIDELLDKALPGETISPVDSTQHYGIYKFQGIDLSAPQPDYQSTLTEKPLVVRLKGEKNFIFGINGHPVNTIPYNGNSSVVIGVTAQQQVDLMVELGVQWYRIDVQTNEVGFAQSDAAFRSVINRCKQVGIQVLPVFYDSSELFQATGDVEGAYQHGFRKMEGVAKNYGDLLTHCELGNEWELFRNLLNKTGPGTLPEHYNLERLAVCKAYVKGMEEGLKSVCRHIKSMVNTAGFYPIYWAHQVFEAAPSIDICAWHWYNEMPNAAKATFGWEDVLPEIYREFGRPIWITESNSRWNSSKPEDVNNQEQVEWFNKFFKDCLEFPQCEAYFVHELLNNVPPNQFSFSYGPDCYRGIKLDLNETGEVGDYYYSDPAGGIYSDPNLEKNYGIYKFDGIDLDATQPDYQGTLTQKPSAAHLIASSYRRIIKDYRHSK